MPSEVSPSLAQPSQATGRSSRLAHRPMTCVVSPSPAQLSQAICVSPSLAHPSGPCGLSPSLAHPYVASGAAASRAYSSQTTTGSPNQARPSVAPSPAKTHSSHSPASSLAEPATAPGLFLPSVAQRESLSLAQSPLCTRLAPSPWQPPVVSGTCCGLSDPRWGSGLDSHLQCLRVNAVAPHLCHLPARWTCGPCPSVAGSVGQGLNPPSLGAGVDPCEKPLMVSETISSLQASKLNDLSLGFHHPCSIGGRRGCPAFVVSVSTPNLSQAGEEACRTGQRTTPLFRGVATSYPQGPVADAMFLSGC
ncbi:uncharacterized protein LOC144580936 [Callithrix jacchus]